MSYTDVLQYMQDHCVECEDDYLTEDSSQEALILVASNTGCPVNR